MVHVFKMILSPGVFFNFLKFWLPSCQWDEKQTIAHNDKKIASVAPHISGIIYHMIFIYGTHVL